MKIGIKGVDGISLSLPRVLKATGVAATIQPLLSDKETQALKKSAEILKTAAHELNY